MTNSAVAAGDTIVVTQQTGANLYQFATKAAAGSFSLSLSAFSGTATEAPVLNFAVIKAT